MASAQRGARGGERSTSALQRNHALERMAQRPRLRAASVSQCRHRPSQLGVPILSPPPRAAFVLSLRPGVS